ncbi:MAG: hypothetical protein K2K84_02710 [Muribaculaceae bacterium]|nr:hypothetical protein [Muribaculaceae bacterium]
MKPDKVLDTTIDTLYNRVSSVIEQARETAYRQINEALVKRNWELGKLIADGHLRKRLYKDESLQFYKFL